MMRVLPEIVLPWAKLSLFSQNSRAHWSVRHRAVKGRKRLATMAAYEAGLHMVKVPAGASVSVQMTFQPPIRVGRFDDDNAIAAQKCALDAIADVLRVDDNVFRIERPKRLPTAGVGSVRLRLTIEAARQLPDREGAE